MSLLLVDIGGQKARRDLDGKWKVLDKKSGDFKCDLNGCKLPFKDNTLDGIFCSHTLEHIEPENILPILKEMRRVLKPKCRVRVVVPDYAKAIQWYMKNPKMLMSESAPTKDKFQPNTKMGYLNSWIYSKGKYGHGHRSGFDMELLTTYLKQAGFKKIGQMTYNKCSKVFNGKDYVRYQGNSIFCEAVK
jgi:predicted SAM-dependent methyltransferase